MVPSDEFIKALVLESAKAVENGAPMSFGTKLYILQMILIVCSIIIASILFIRKLIKKQLHQIKP